MSLPAGIVPLQPLAKGKVAETQPTERFPVHSSGPDPHLNHTGRRPASPTSGGRRGGRWTMGLLRGVLRDQVSRWGWRGWAWSQDYIGCSSLTCLTAPDTYVIKLFDRSVDLAQFSENTPLYPICRAWMRNSPTVRERERSPGSPLPPLPEDGEVEGVSGGQRAVGARSTATPLVVDSYNLWAPQGIENQVGHILR